MDSMNEVTESLKQFALREKDGSGLSEGVDSLDQRTSENPPDVTESTVHATPSRSSGKPKLSSVSQSHVQTGSLGSYRWVVSSSFDTSGNDTRVVRRTWPSQYRSTWSAPSNARQLK